MQRSRYQLFPAPVGPLNQDRDVFAGYLTHTPTHFTRPRTVPRDLERHVCRAYATRPVRPHALHRTTDPLQQALHVVERLGQHMMCAALEEFNHLRGRHLAHTVRDATRDARRHHRVEHRQVVIEGEPSTRTKSHGAGQAAPPMAIDIRAGATSAPVFRRVCPKTERLPSSSLSNTTDGGRPPRLAGSGGAITSSYMNRTRLEATNPLRLDTGKGSRPTVQQPKTFIADRDGCSRSTPTEHGSLRSGRFSPLPLHPKGWGPSPDFVGDPVDQEPRRAARPFLGRTIHGRARDGGMKPVATKSLCPFLTVLAPIVSTTCASPKSLATTRRTVLGSSVTPVASGAGPACASSSPPQGLPRVHSFNGLANAGVVYMDVCGMQHIPQVANV